MGKTFSEKVLAKKAGLDEVVPSQIVIVKPEHLLAYDNLAAIVGKIKDDLKEFGVARPDMPVIILDHVIPAANEKYAINHQTARNFVKNNKIKNFFDVGTGICHQVFMEKGLAHPLINETDLVKALPEGWIAGAGLDALEQEPHPKVSPL